MAIKLTGTNKIFNALKNKGKFDAVKTTVKLNGAEMQRKAQVYAPVDTGQLRRSIRLYITDNGMAAEVAATALYASYVEYGTRFMAANPYIRPAYYQQRQQFYADLNRLMS